MSASLQRLGGSPQITLGKNCPWCPGDAEAYPGPSLALHLAPRKGQSLAGVPSSEVGGTPAQRAASAPSALWTCRLGWHWGAAWHSHATPCCLGQLGALTTLGFRCPPSWTQPSTEAWARLEVTSAYDPRSRDAHEGP